MKDTMKIVTTDSENKAVLYKVASEVEIPLTKTTKEKIEAMRIFYKSFQGKAGFAAPQVGLSERIILVEQHLFDTTMAEETDEPTILVNPSWRPISDKKEWDIEGCLSVPGKVGVVKRYVHVELTAWLYHSDTEALSKIKREYHREYSSVLWQHEIDHLEGKIYVDKAKLLLNEKDFYSFRQQLIESGKIQSGMALFDLGPLIYDIVVKGEIPS